MAGQKPIQVAPEVHAEVKKIAQANYRGLGDQIRAWAFSECDHDEKFREPVFVVFVTPDDMSQEKQAQGFRCGICGRIVSEELEKIALRPYPKLTLDELKRQNGKKLLDAVKVKG